MEKVTLIKPAIIAGTPYPEGHSLYISDMSVVEAGYKEYEKATTRQKLASVGLDTATTLGKVSDAAQLALLAAVRTFIAEDMALQQATNAEEYFQAKKSLYANNQELVQMGYALLAGLENGSIKLTPISKGLAEVNAEILSSFTQMSTVFEGTS
jgi:hypothetical protein